MYEINDYLQREASNWYKIAICLKLRPSVLDSIKKETAECSESMTRVITNWLKQNYKVERFGVPTWEKLVEAMKASNGGNNASLAEEIARQHPSTG